MSEFNQARRDGVIKFGYDFSNLAEVTHLWGISTSKLPKIKHYKIPGRYFKIPGRENAICQLLSGEVGGGWRRIPYRGMKMDGRGWSEIVRIDEVNSDPEMSAQRVMDELVNPLERYVFWRESRGGESWYKFHGVFKLDETETRAYLKEGENVCIYRRISYEGTCQKCEVQPRSISAEEFLSAEGKILSANLLDVVHCEYTGGKCVTDDVNVWPGQKFLVKCVSPATQVAICETSDDNVLKQVSITDDVRFVIPKRDVELGYFSILEGKGTLEDTVPILDASDRKRHKRNCKNSEEER